MFDSIHLMGEGRAGSVLAARLRDAEVHITVGRLPDPEAELVILAIPDRVIAEVARGVPAGAWMCHVSGATNLTALDPHKDDDFPRWLGWPVVVAGIGSIVVGVIQAQVGESTGISRVASIVFPTIITLWVAALGIMLMRRATHESAPHAPSAS